MLVTRLLPSLGTFWWRILLHYLCLLLTPLFQPILSYNHFAFEVTAPLPSRLILAQSTDRFAITWRIFEAGSVMAKIFRKTCAVIMVSKDVNLFSRLQRQWPFSFDYWHCCNIYNKQLNKSSELAKHIFASAFWCDHHLVVEILCRRWTLWMLLSSCTLSYLIFF